MLNTYLNFDGNCREAFEFYRSVFGGEFSIIQTFREAPADENVEGFVSEAEMDNIMHVSYPIGGSILMGSDMPSGAGMPHIVGSNFSISVSPTSRAEADRLFAALSAGGAPMMPMSDMFWGSYFGMCKDKFGISWQINYEQQPAQA